MQKLIALGDLSSLAPRLEPIGDHDYENPEHGVTVAYSRDRNEKGTKAHESESYSDAMRLNMGQEFAYFFVPWNEDPTTGKWECIERNSRGLLPYCRNELR